MREGISGRVVYLFTGLPAAFFLNSLLVWRITPAIWELSWMERTGGSVYLFILAAIAAVASLSFGFERARTLGWSRAPAWALLTCVPILGVGIALWMAAAGGEKDQRGDSPAWRLAGRLVVPAIVGWMVVAALTGPLGLLLTFLEMPKGAFYLSWTIVVLTPVATAFIAGFVAGRAGRDAGEARSVAQLALLAIMTGLGFAMMEGVVCMLMVAPLVLIAAWPASWLGHCCALNSDHPSDRVQCAAWLVVAACAVGEANLPTMPLEDTVITEMVIEAAPARVWAELKDIRDLPAPTEALFILGVAHPIETVVDGPGRVGAHRVCRLSTGDMTELISVWEPERELRFTVLDTPPLMREATFFGRELDAPHLHGTYTGLEGGFRLEPLPGGRTRLVGTSRYALSIAPSRYWNLWTREIVSQVHLRVMRHVKAKAEAR